MTSTVLRQRRFSVKDTCDPGVRESIIDEGVKKEFQASITLMERHKEEQKDLAQQQGQRLCKSGNHEFEAEDRRMHPMGRNAFVCYQCQREVQYGEPENPAIRCPIHGCVSFVIDFKNESQSTEKKVSQSHSFVGSLIISWCQN